MKFEMNFELDEFTRIVRMHGDQLVLNQPPPVPRCDMQQGKRIETQATIDGVYCGCSLIRGLNGSIYQYDDEKFKKAIHGEVRKGYVLKELPRVQNAYERKQRVMIKAVNLRSANSFVTKEDPLSEMYFLQSISPEITNISHQIDCIVADGILYSVMPDYGKELYSFAGKLSPDEIKTYYRQIVKAIQKLQELRICHRDLSLENILVDSEKRECTVIDFGMSFLVPYARQSTVRAMAKLIVAKERNVNSYQDEGLTDIEDESFEDEWQPLLILPQGVYGKDYFIAPEIFDGHSPIDGTLVDNWALSVMLFMLFTGRAPFKRASQNDKWFRLVQRSSLKELLQKWKIYNIPDDAVDLMEKMLKMGVCPKTRYTTDDILSHQWMAEE